MIYFLFFQYFSLKFFLYLLTLDDLKYLITDKYSNYCKHLKNTKNSAHQFLKT